MKDLPKVDKLFRIKNQNLHVSHLDFATKSIKARTRMTVIPIDPNLTTLALNCDRKQIDITSIEINNYKAEFSFNDIPDEPPESLSPSMHHFTHWYYSHYRNIYIHGGELSIKIPTEVSTDCKSFSLSIEYQIINPKSGIQFVVPSTDNEHIKKSFHAFTCGHYNSSRLWFPCMDNYWNLCTWSLSFNVDATMIAISNGELVKKIIDDDGKNVTFHYKLDVPTAAPNIGFAIGYFEIFVDPKIPTVTHFCLPGLLPVLKHSVSLFHKAYDLYQSILSARFPFKSYKQVFVNESYNNCSTYSSLSILNTGLLHSARIIEQHHLSQHVMAIALAQQYFGCFVGIETWNDWWLTAGISGYLSAIFIKRRFGTSEYKHYIHKEMEALSEYEFAGPPLPPLHVDETLTQVHTDISVAYTNQQDRIPINYHPCFTFPTQLEMFERRSQLIMRMIEIRIGQESLLQAFNKLLTLANTGAKHHSHSSQWGNLLISTKHFLKTIHLVSGKDIKEFINQWVCRSGLPHFKGSFSFNRKRNTLELELTEKQDKSQFGFYVGPLTICVQEVDGSYTHTLQIEESTYHYDISCHSKSKKNKKKKIPLSNGDETEINFSSADSDSPVLWVRIDPDMHWLRKVTFDQPDYMWQYQMKYERDSLAQYLAVKALAKYVSADSVCCLTEIINDRHIYYRIRVAAINALAKCATETAGEWALQRCSIATSLFNIYRKMFGSRSCQTIPRYNDFSYMIGYFIQKAIPKALGSIRNSHGNCPREILDFIIDLIKYNDNSQNEYSDNYYMSSLIDALTSAISPATTITGISESNYTLSEESKIILQEVTHALNYEKILASHRNCISVSCIKNIRMLQKKGHIPPRADVFRMYARYGFFQDIREAAIDQLADFIKVESSVADLRWIFSLIEKDPVPFMRHYALQAIIRSAPFSNLKRTTSALNNIELVERLWTLIGFDTKHDCRLRCDAMELYTELYGRSTPDCIPPILNSPGVVIDLQRRTSRPSISPSMSFDDISFKVSKPSTPQAVATPIGLNSDDDGSSVVSGQDALKVTIKLGDNTFSGTSIATENINPIGKRSSSDDVKSHKKHKHKHKKSSKQSSPFSNPQH